MNRPFTLNRRQFSASLLAGSLAPLTAHAAPRVGVASRRSSPNDRITLGIIGVGKMGLGHLNRFVGYDDVQVIAVSDVVAERTDNAQQLVNRRYADAESRASYQGCDRYSDFRILPTRLIMAFELPGGTP